MDDYDIEFNEIITTLEVVPYAVLIDLWLCQWEVEDVEEMVWRMPNWEGFYV